MGRTVLKKTEDMSNKVKPLLPRTKLGKVMFAIEAWLYRHGISAPSARALIAVQVMIAAALVLLGAALCWYTLWVLWVGLGAVLTVVNFYFIAQKLQAFYAHGLQKGSIMKMLLNFYFRLFVTAIFLFVFIVWLKAPIVALLVGLSLSVATATIFGFARLHMLKSKEATDNA